MLQVAHRARTSNELLFGGIWIGPGPDNKGQDLGQDNADRTVAAAIAAGITEFDTAPWYGSGCAEERLGRAVQQLPGASGAKVITKAGRLVTWPDGRTPCTMSFDALAAPSWKERVVRNDFTAQGALSSLSESLERMRSSSVYGIRIHDPNDNSNADGSIDEVVVALAPNGMLEGLRKLRQEGRIQHVGLGMNCNREAHQGVPDQVLRLLEGAPEGTFDSALLAGGWNLLSQDGLPCLLECQRRKIEVHIAGVFASGLLVGVDRYAYKAAPAEMLAKADRWRKLAAKHGCSLPAVAMAFAALPVVVSRVVLGMATPEQVEQAVSTLSAAASVPITIWHEAKQIGLLAEGVPVPQ